MVKTSCYPIQALVTPVKTYHFNRGESLYRLRMIPTDTLVGYSIRKFLNEGIEHSNQLIFDYCVKMLQDQIHDNPEAMEMMLGTAYDYFKYLKI